ncbi:endonuclease/exonuclease/phosphatase family protein [Arenicella xantha]|uniref:Endonuclease/exonuclease/phosphatase family metal-dependent hydrolase n=1 Tax=Arenicella xantha TaxID=644221 RepID=A0A395JRJ2_9GAMM|nr:endonuclease/exonuclease/phosphatase family protein [Arenicella xantha]RBP52952.1 endonuclease/exonuclease/phosphatase family metal-dependent hydrolase [Arenicella xantha]
MGQRQQQPLIGSLFIVGVSTILALSHFTSDLHSPALFIFKAALQPITVATLLCFGIYAAWRKHKWLYSALCYALFINLIFIAPNFRISDTLDQKDAVSSLTIATFSTLTRTSNTSDIIKFARSEAPDLLCLQEVAQKDRKLIAEQLNKLYPHKTQNTNNQLTLSRFPLRSIKDVGYFQASLLSHPKFGPIRVINAHMHRPYLSDGIAESWQELFKFIDDSSAAIICGDLNITPNNSLYDLLISRYGFNDSIISGYGFTYPNAQRRSAILGTLIRIDYILGRAFIPIHTQTVNASNLSDHRAVVSELIFDVNRQSSP